MSDGGVPVDSTGSARVRNQNACDKCRDRKVKCFSQAGRATCDGCLRANAECTRDRPRKRRGPKATKAGTRHGSISKRALSACSSSGPPTQTPVADSYEYACWSPGCASAHSRAGESQSIDALLSPGELGSTASTVSTTSVSASPGSSQAGWLSQFAPPASIERIVDAWFQRIYALAPVLHRRRFLRRLRRGDGDTDAVFAALVISVCAATIATLRRDNYRPVTAAYCIAFVCRFGLLSQKAYSLEWCVATYNFGIASQSASGIQDMTSYDSLASATAGARYLAYYRLESMDRVDQELLKRLLWLLFAACTIDILGGLVTFAITRQEAVSRLKPLPLTDAELDPAAYEDDSGFDAWHGDHTSYVAGLNHLTSVYWVWHEWQTACPRPAAAGKAELLSLRLREVQQAIDDLPPELRWRGRLSRLPGATESHDVQIANIFITSFQIRSNLLQACGAESSEAIQEQRRLVDDLLEVLYHMPDAVFDVNGISMVPKIRDIGAAFVEHLVTELDDGGGSTLGDETASQKLQRLLRKLDDLDLSQSAAQSGASAVPGTMR